MFKQLREDIALVKERDPAARSAFEIWLTYSGLHAVHSYRRAHWFYKHGMLTIARIISQFARFRTGIEIHPGAKIGKGLFIDHGMACAKREPAEIADIGRIYQCATLGGTGQDKGKRHPTLGDNVMVGAGAKVLGPFKIGNNVKIAANAVVLEEIPDNCTAAGVPARIVKNRGVRVKVCKELDQIHIPDPVSQEMCSLEVKVEKLMKRIDELENKENA